MPESTVGDLLAPAATGAVAAVNEGVPLAVPFFVLLVGITAIIALFRKFGIKR